MPAFSDRLDERLKIGGTPRPADLTSIESDLNSIDTTLTNSSVINTDQQALFEDRMLSMAEEIAVNYRDQ